MGKGILVYVVPSAEVIVSLVHVATAGSAMSLLQSLQINILYSFLRLGFLPRHHSRALSHAVFGDRLFCF